MRSRVMTKTKSIKYNNNQPFSGWLLLCVQITTVWRVFRFD
jgi:hypothetical protein